MKDFLIKNVFWIGLAVVVIVGSNLLTGVTVTSMSRKDKQLLKERIDSITRLNDSIQIERVLEAKKRLRLEIEKDSINLVISERLTRTEILLKSKDIEIRKLKKLNTHQLGIYADSLYNAYH